MLSVIYGTELNQDGIYQVAEEKFEELKKNISTYQVFQGKELVYARAE